MPKNLFEIISEVMNIPISQINDDSGAGTIEEWDSFNMYVLLNEIEKEFNINNLPLEVKKHLITDDNFKIRYFIK